MIRAAMPAVVVCIALGCVSQAGVAQVSGQKSLRLPKVFADHMVLQRDMPAAIAAL